MVKKSYYQLSTLEFNKYLEQLKNESTTLHFFKSTSTPYFLSINQEINLLIVDLHKKQLELDHLYKSLPAYQMRMIKETCMLDEIQSTNKTENIYSTRSDIFGIVNNVKSIHNRKIISIIHSYDLLNELSKNNIEELSQVRELYEMLMDHAYESSKDKIDGIYFRKNKVHIMNGIKVVHTGFYPEENIIQAMEEYLQVINDPNLDIYLRILITHFMFETIHPYYDGNGRCGRFLMSLKLNHEESTLFAYCIASSINANKSKYYKALESARDIHEFGCINDYILSLGKILLDGMNHMILDIQQKLQSYQSIKETLVLDHLTKSEKIIYDHLLLASLFTYFGISNEQIIEDTKISKRTLITTMNKFRELNLLDDLKLGKITYHKLKGITNDFVG